MERKTDKQDFITWELECYECGDKFEAYSWRYDDPPIEFCCSQECYYKYETIESKRDRKLKRILNEV